MPRHRIISGHRVECIGGSVGSSLLLPYTASQTANLHEIGDKPTPVRIHTVPPTGGFSDARFGSAGRCAS